MKVAVTGASGLLGRALTASLCSDGHSVLRLVRHPPRSEDEASWDPTGGTIDLDRLDRVDAVVNLAGAGVGDHRWTNAYKQVLWDSRISGTRTLSEALASLDPRPRALVSASAIGYYGDTGDRAAGEDAPAGDSFLARLCVAWEAAADPARAAGVRVTHPRTGLVVAAGGGAWGRLVPIFRLGAGGRVGSGRQYWSLISLEDEVRALQALIERDDLDGPYNLTAPQPATNAEVTRLMGRVLHRPAVVPVPALALRLALGEFAGEILASQRVVPERLLAAGFSFHHPDAESALRASFAA